MSSCSRPSASVRVGKKAIKHLSANASAGDSCHHHPGDDNWIGFPMLATLLVLVSLTPISLQTPPSSPSQGTASPSMKSSTYGISSALSMRALLTSPCCTPPDARDAASDARRCRPVRAQGVAMSVVASHA
ncbi:hypothetical protein MSAN_01749100 [Mycena sanguinolenta]|uniref:Uncharacterized protein n=1 Tax=Mycena sanguinolenta TaxID=230812 RepID=A0A8H6XTS5_9AGAR|nr:hypothetical protein MSAN_01749100 [Mycena sanguinolenta]